MQNSSRNYTAEKPMPRRSQSQNYRKVHPENFNIKSQVQLSVQLSEFLTDLAPRIIEDLQNEGVDIPDTGGLAAIFRQGAKELIIRLYGQPVIPSDLDFQPSRRLPNACINGHEYAEATETEKASYYMQKGRRICRFCHIERVNASNTKRAKKVREAIPPLNDTYLANFDKVEALRLAALTAYNQLAKASTQMDRTESSKLAHALQDIFAQARSMSGPPADIEAIEKYIRSVAD